MTSFSFGRAALELFAPMLMYIFDELSIEEKTVENKEIETKLTSERRDSARR